MSNYPHHLHVKRPPAQSSAAIPAEDQIPKFLGYLLLKAAGELALISVVVGVAGDDDGSFAIATNIAGLMQQGFTEDQRGSRRGDDPMNKRWIFARRLHNALLPTGGLVGTRNHAGAPVIGAELSQIGEGLYVVAMKQTVEGVTDNFRSHVMPTVATWTVVVITWLAAIDRGLGFRNLRRISQYFFAHPHKAPVSGIFQKYRIRLEEMVEVMEMPNSSLVHHAVSDRLPAPRVVPGVELSLELVQSVEYEPHLVFVKDIFHNHVAVNLQVPALGWRQCEERRFHSGGIQLDLHLYFLTRGYNLWNLERIDPSSAHPA